MAMGPGAEFDRYARDYEDLLRDPVRESFVRSGEFYHRRKWVLIAGFLARHALPPAKMAWLDVGCGKGELLGFGRARFARLAGCDPSREMAREVDGMEVRFQPGPATLPFEDASFDLATAVCVYHHVEEANRLPLTREIHRVLRPGGVFCMIEHNPFNPVTRSIVRRCPIDADAHLLPARRASFYAAAAGLRPLAPQYFLYLPERLYNLAGGLERLVRRLPLGGQYAVFARK